MENSLHPLLLPPHVIAAACLTAIAAILYRYGCFRALCRAWDSCESELARLAQRTAVPLCLVGAVSLGISIYLSLGIHWPLPRVMDEFSYLLAGDTFAHGRLTNAPHPMWVHLETMHELQQPSYASKYPPGQGLFLAFGQILSGAPLVGVWLSTALACAAITWMLRGFLPGRWALVGGLMAALHPTVIKWSQCYWGGSVALLGGALLLGGAVRLPEKLRPRDAAVAAAGIALLANARPFEGLVLTLLTLFGAAPQIWRVLHYPPAHPDARLERVRPRRTLAAFLAPLVLSGLWMAYYNFRVTGSALTLPYVLYGQTYEMSPLFVFQKPPAPPVYRHLSLQQHAFFEEYVYYRQLHSLRGFAQSLVPKSASLFNNAFELFDTRECQGENLRIAGWPAPWYGYVPLLALLGLPAAFRRSPALKLAVAALLLFSAILFCNVGMNLPYTAPALPLVFLLLTAGLQELRIWRWRDRAIGKTLTRLVAAAFALSFLSICWQLRSQNFWPGQRRQQILDQIEKQPGKHLILVHYDPGEVLHEEWVYNEADIDGSRVVWARMMDPAHDRELLRYFHDRRVWTVEAP